MIFFPFNFNYWILKFDILFNWKIGENKNKNKEREQNRKNRNGIQSRYVFGFVDISLTKLSASLLALQTNPNPYPPIPTLHFLGFRTILNPIRTLSIRFSSTSLADRSSDHCSFHRSLSIFPNSPCQAMDGDSWSARLSSATKRYQSALQSRSGELDKFGCCVFFFGEEMEVNERNFFFW